MSIEFKFTVITSTLNFGMWLLIHAWLKLHFGDITIEVRAWMSN